MKMKSAMRQLLRSPREFPVEAALGVTFFLIAAYHTATQHWDEKAGMMISGIDDDVLLLFVPLVVLTFCLGKVNRWAYVASYFLFLPLMALNLQPFLWTFAHGFTYVLAAILLVVGTRPMDNRLFGVHALHVVTQLFLGLLVAGVLNLALMAIVVSVEYIFGLDFPNEIYLYILHLSGL